jgi:hypothetical protein
MKQQLGSHPGKPVGNPREYSPAQKNTNGIVEAALKKAHKELEVLVEVLLKIDSEHGLFAQADLQQLRAKAAVDEGEALLDFAEMVLHSCSLVPIPGVAAVVKILQGTIIMARRLCDIPSTMLDIYDSMLQIGHYLIDLQILARRMKEETKNRLEFAIKSLSVVMEEMNGVTVAFMRRGFASRLANVSRMAKQVDSIERKKQLILDSISHIMQNEVKGMLVDAKDPIERGAIEEALSSMNSTLLSSNKVEEARAKMDEAMEKEAKRAHALNNGQALNDSAKGGIDRFGYGRHATSLFEVVAHCPPPLCIGLYAKWGTGKSFMITLLKKAFDPKVREDERTHELMQWFDDGFDKLAPAVADELASESALKELALRKGLMTDHSWRSYLRYSRVMLPKRLEMCCCGMPFALATMLSFKWPLWLETISQVLGESFVGTYIQLTDWLHRFAPREMRYFCGRNTHHAGTKGTTFNEGIRNEHLRYESLLRAFTTMLSVLISIGVYMGFGVVAVFFIIEIPQYSQAQRAIIGIVIGTILGLIRNAFVIMRIMKTFRDNAAFFRLREVAESAYSVVPDAAEEGEQREVHDDQNATSNESEKEYLFVDYNAW